MSPADLVSHAASRGVRLRVVGGALRCLSAGPLPDDLRGMLAARKVELLAHLTGPQLGRGQPWNPRESCRLLETGDALAERLGVDGRHPLIADAAARVCSASATRDLETLRFAVAEFGAAVRGLAADSAKPGGRLLSAETTAEGHER